MTHLELLKKLVGENSIYPNEQNLGEFLIGYLKNLGFEVQKQYLDEEFVKSESDKTRFNILAQRGNFQKSLLFYAHIDTVPVHDEKLWNSNPFELTQDKENKNIFYGLGSTDMKGGVVGILKAIEKTSSTHNIKVVLACDEEAWSKGSNTLLKSDFLDDVVGAFVPEIGTNNLPVKANTQNIILGRRGRLVIEILVPGKSCHGALANHEWINAISQASIIALEIEKNQETKNDGILPIGNQFVKTFSSTVSSLSVPDEAKLVIDRHTVLGETPQSVLQEIQNLIQKLYDEKRLVKIPGLEISIKLFDRPTPIPQAYKVDENNFLVELAKKGVLQNYEKYNIGYGFSIADENFLAQKIDVITLGPKGGNEHGANEWVEIESIEKLSKIYEFIIENI